MPAINPVPLPAIAFSKNRLRLILQSDDYLADVPAASVNFLAFADAVADGESFVLAWTGAKATMTASADPDDTGIQFPAGDGSEAYVTGLLDWFRGNYFLSRVFIISTDFTGDHPRLLFTAKTDGPDYDFTGLVDGVTGVAVPGVTDAPKSNFRHHFQLWVANAEGTAFLQALGENIPLDYPQTGQSSFDINDALDAFLQPDRPELTDPYAVCLNSSRQYFFKYAQYYGDDPFIHKLITSDIFTINKGGLSKPQALQRDLMAELTVPGHPEQGRFLRQGSVNKLVTPEQPEWLTWINLSAADKLIYPEVTIYYDDETNFVFNAVNGINVLAWQKIQLQAGYTQLGIAAQNPDKTVIYYKIRINEAGNSLTAYYAYVLDYKFREWPRYIVYWNSYGAYQTIGTVGKGQAEVDRSKDDAQMAVDPYTAAIDGEFLETNIRIQDKLTVNIGYERSGKRNTALLRDLMASPKIFLYQVLPTGEDPIAIGLGGAGTLIPVGLNTQNLKDAADGVNVYANTLEFYPLYSDVVFTEDPAMVTDDTVPELLAIAGSPIPPILVDPGDGGDPGTGGGSGSYIPVPWNDPHLSLDAGRTKYTAPILVGKDGYPIRSTQLGGVFRPEDLSYNSEEGSVIILVPGFAVNPGDMLFIYPYAINPDEV